MYFEKLALAAWIIGGRSQTDGGRDIRRPLQWSMQVTVGDVTGDGEQWTGLNGI